MGVIQDLLDNATTFAVDPPRTGTSKAIHRQLMGVLQSGDFDRPESCDGVNEIQKVNQFVFGNGGTYKLYFTLHGGISFHTHPIDFDASHGQVQCKIDEVASCHVPEWCNGDIEVCGGPLDCNDMIFKFCGHAVRRANHSPIVVGTDCLTYDGAQGIAGAATTTIPGVMATTDEVQSIAVFANNVTGGTFDLTFHLDGEDPVAVGSIAFDSNAAAIQTAVDAALTGQADPGDVVISGGPLNSAPLTITFSGDDVDETNQGQTTIDGTSLTATVEGTAGTTCNLVNGQTTRHAWAALIALGILDPNVELPEQADALFEIPVLATKGHFPYQLDDFTVLAIINEIASQDDASLLVKESLLKSLGF